MSEILIHYLFWKSSKELFPFIALKITAAEQISEAQLTTSFAISRMEVRNGKFKKNIYCIKTFLSYVGNQKINEYKYSYTYFHNWLKLLSVQFSPLHGHDKHRPQWQQQEARAALCMLSWAHVGMSCFVQNMVEDLQHNWVVQEVYLMREEGQDPHPCPFLYPHLLGCSSMRHSGKANKIHHNITKAWDCYV